MIDPANLLAPDPTGINPWLLNPQRWQFKTETPSPRELRVLEKLRSVMTEIWQVSAPDCVRQVFDFVRDEKSTDVAKLAKTFAAARRSFDMLIKAGHAHECYRDFFDNCLQQIAFVLRRELLRRLLTGEIENDKAQEALTILAGQIESGGWTDWQRDVEQVESALVA